MKTLKLRWVGQTPLLMSSDKLANPLSAEYAEMKPLTSKRNKTPDDYAIIMKLEWKYLMYYNKKIGPFIPANNVKQCIIQGGAPRRLGPKLCGILINADSLKIPLQYKGPKDLTGIEKRFNEFNLITSVVVSGKRVMKCRPKFDGWSIEFEVIYDESDLSDADIIQACEYAGRMKGLCGWRPARKGEYGRFTVETV